MKIENYTPEKLLLKDKVIAVTGAGAGIGRCMAKAYAYYGASVILLGRTVKKLEEVYDEIEAAGDPEAAIFPIDFNTATEADYEILQTAIEENFGHLNGLLNNASVLGVMTSIGSYKLNVWETVFKVNVTAPFALTKALLPLMQKAKQASIIFTGSTIGLEGRAYWGAYGASKAATENLMQTLASELEGITSIRVNSVNPGATRTSMRASAYPAEDPKTLKLPEDLIPLYVYLMGKDSINSTGQQFSA